MPLASPALTRLFAYFRARCGKLPGRQKNGEMKPETIEILDEKVPGDARFLSLVFFNEIEATEFEKILLLKHLTHLNLASADLLDTHLETIGKMEHLELLDLDSTEISDQGLRYLEPLKKLRQLRLKDNPQLTDACIAHLIKIPSLEMVHLGNTSISLEGIEKLLSNVELESIVVEQFDFRDSIDALCALTRDHPSLEITVKGTGIIARGKVNG